MKKKCLFTLGNQKANAKLLEHTGSLEIRKEIPVVLENRSRYDFGRHEIGLLIGFLLFVCITLKIDKQPHPLYHNQKDGFNHEWDHNSTEKKTFCPQIHVKQLQVLLPQS